MSFYCLVQAPWWQRWLQTQLPLTWSGLGFRSPAYEMKISYPNDVTLPRTGHLGSLSVRTWRTLLWIDKRSRPTEAGTKKKLVPHVSEVLTVSANRELCYVKRPNNGPGLWTIPSSRSGAVVAQFRAKKGARIVGWSAQGFTLWFVPDSVPGQPQPPWSVILCVTISVRWTLPLRLSYSWDWDVKRKLIRKSFLKKKTYFDITTYLNSASCHIL